MKPRIASIAVSLEHVRAAGRMGCEGIAEYSHRHPGWRLSMFEDGLPPPETLKEFDGFLWAIKDERTARSLVATGKPVVDLQSDGIYPGTFAVLADHDACGRLAAGHFFSRKFRRFAFCGWSGLNFSQAREKAYAQALAEKWFSYDAYRSKGSSLLKFHGRHVDRERLSMPSDADAILKWLRALPKPVAVFCANDLRAWHVAEICAHGALRVPDEVAVLGADNDPVPCRFIHPPLSSVDTAAYDIGYRAAEVLAEVLGGRRDASERIVTVPPRGIEARGSTEIYPVDPPWLADALAFIHGTVEGCLTAGDVVRRVGKSHSTVEAAFRRLLGCGIQKEIMAARLDAAERLLRTTTLPLRDVARRSGFATQQYFGLCFARRHGVAPSVWRIHARARLQ